MSGPLIGLAVAALPVLIWALFRGKGYKRTPLKRAPGAEWEKTDESFIDSQSGAKVEVWYCPRNGERAYVHARGSPASGWAACGPLCAGLSDDGLRSVATSTTRADVR